MSCLASASTASSTTPQARMVPLGVKQPAWRTHRVRAVVGIALVTGSFIASGPLVAAAAGHQPTRPAELRTPQPSEAPGLHEASPPLDDAGVLKR